MLYKIVVYNVCKNEDNSRRKVKSERKVYCMRVNLNDVAIIKSADIQLDGITVVAGLNGTGKTTVGKGIYATINAFSNLPQKIFDSRRKSIRSEILTILANKHYQLQVPIRFITRMMNELTDEILGDWIQDNNLIKSQAKKWMIKNLPINFDDDLLDILVDKIIAIIDRPIEQDIRFILDTCYRDVFSEQINSFNSGKPARFKVENENKVSQTSFHENHIASYHWNFGDDNAFYIESRNIIDEYNQIYLEKGLTIASKNLLGALTGGEKEMQDDLTVEEYERMNVVKKIVSSIINEVTHGRLKGDNFSNIMFYDEKTSSNVEIANVSAGIKIFVVIQRLLENGSLKAGDVLLIDEPEVNLHPEWQIVFAEILVRLYKELGIIIYLNSHSPYFIRAIEIKLAENDIGDKGRFYLTHEAGNDLYEVNDVTDNKEAIYELLYKPLEEL